MIVLDASETLFLGGGDNLAVRNQAGSRIVIERRDAKDFRHWLSR
jgi:hypothetical protein